MFGRKEKKENEVLSSRVQQLEQTIHNLGGGDAIKMQNYIDFLQNNIRDLEEERNRVRHQIDELEGQRSSLKAVVAEMDDAKTLQGFNWFEFENPAEDSVRLESELSEVRAAAKSMVSSKTAVRATENFTFNNSSSKGRSFVGRMQKLALRSYNAEVENAVTRMKAGNLEAGIKRVNRAREQVERMGQMIDLGISDHYHGLRLEELRLAAQHLEAKKAAKEAEREEKARLREEKKAQKELEAERIRLQKEEAHYLNAIAKLRAKGNEEEVGELESKLKDIRMGLENVDYRRANIKAGYVYVISNIGSFGEHMVKIGMTRRLDPMDRVRELGDASVPFNFDVHALHFSENAVSIENQLHKRFAHSRVNRINNRREFFYATPAEVKQALLEVEGNVLEYHDEPDAEQFRLSQAIIEEESQRVTDSDR